jgi:UDPglucose 6-dehydrogenase
MRVDTICCIGAGYVGGPTMAVIALKCPSIKVIVVDQNADRIDAWNSENLDLLPVYEPGLREIIATTRNKNLFFSTQIDEAINASEMIFMAVNTPTKTTGEGAGMAADLTHVERCARRIANVATSNKIVIEKSTLPVRTAEKIKSVLSSNTKVQFEVLSNPEFLAEGTAIEDLFKSDRVLIGGDATPTGQTAVEALVSIYAQWIPKDKIITTNVWSSELSKLASNAMLAQRISSINSLSALCEKTGASIEEVAKAIGKDHRIGDKFLNASVGFGGSCFQKDILNLVYLCQTYGLEEVADYWHQILKINDYQKNRFATKIAENFQGKLHQTNIAILGWAFKKNTNDSRESAAIYVAAQLLEQGAQLTVYDPMVAPERIIQDLSLLFEAQNKSQEETEKLLAQLAIQSQLFETLTSTNATAILTEWDEFIEFDWEHFLKSSAPNYLVFDGRNIINKGISKNIYSIGN